MQWSEVTAPPKTKTLRQFAGLCLLFAGGFVAWCAWHVTLTEPGLLVAAASAAVGLIGLVRPAAIRPIYTGWMMVVFPIGWTVSRVMIGVMFFVVFTPVALIFRLMGRDALELKRARRATYWSSKSGPGDAAGYLRQS